MSSANTPTAGLDLSHLEGLVQFYFSKGLASSTQRTYRAGQNRFLKFCQENNVSTPLPLSEDLLCSFVAVLADQGLRHRSVKVYLSALRFMQIQAGLKDPFAHVAWPRLDYVVKGIKKVEAEKGVATRTRLPITPSILQRSWTALNLS